MSKSIDGRIGLQTLIFVDDLLRGAKNMNCLRSGYVKLDYVLKEVLGDIEVKKKKKRIHISGTNSAVKG